MASSDTQQGGDWKKRETLGSAFIQIAVVAAVLVLAVFAVYKRGTTRKELAELMRDARAAAIKGNPADLRKGASIAGQALEKDPKMPDALAFSASVYTDLWTLHREDGAEQKAKDFLDRARKADAQTEERYGAEALQLVAAGQPKQADEFVESLRKKGASSAKLFYAQGLALKQLGNLQLARTGFTTAMDKSWKDPIYSAAWGELIIAEGGIGAMDAFTKSLGSNPDYFRAKLGLALSRVMRKDKVGEAETMVKEVLARDTELSPPLKARALAIQAAVLVYQEQPDQAMSMADQALALAGDDVWALFAKANALALKKDAAAPAAYDAVISKDRTSPVFYFEGAQRLQAAGMTPAAMALLDKYEATFKDVKNTTADNKVVAWLDRDDKYWLTRGDLFREQGKLEEAMAAYDKAIAARGLSLQKAYYAKGAVFLAKKDYDNAATMLRDITPPDGTGQLAEAYAAMGEVMFAKKEWGEGCQNYAYALTRFKAQQLPREQLNALLGDVEKKLRTSGQPQIAKVWIEQAKPLIE